MLSHLVRLPAGLFASLAVCCVVAISTSAQEPRTIEPAFEGCGKAHALLRAGDKVPQSPVAAMLEPLAASDALHYDLDVEVSNINTGANTCTITGTCRMTIQSKSPTLTEFTFRLRNQFNVTSALVNDTTPVTVNSISTTTRVATLDRAYGMDEVFTLTIAYTGTTFSAGFGSIEVRGHASGSVVATLSEPYYAYTWWPVKDSDVFLPGDNSDKSTMDISITAPNNYAAPSNGVLQSVDVLSGSRRRYNWSSSYPIAPYLVSFAASNYTMWTQNYVHAGGSMPVQFFIYPHNDTPANRAGWEKAIDMMEVFAPLYGEYPFIDEKYGLYNFPFSGGMEHQTMTGQSAFNESLTAHELGHQWWGDAVTCRTWSDIWLNEGFATFSEAIWEEFKTGSQNVPAYLAAMIARKPVIEGRTLYVPAAETNSVSRIFDSNLSYRKGAWVLHQLRHVVGEANFWQILADYRAAFEGSAANTDDFAAVASDVFGQDLSWFFQQWVYQGGAPTYQFGWDTVNIEGQTYLHAKVAQVQIPSYPHVFTMPVDLRATIGGAPQTVSVWNDARSQWFVRPLSGTPTSVALDPDQWILRGGVSAISIRAGSLDGDNDVDSADFAAFETCYSGPGGGVAADCEPVDFTGDGDVDCDDYAQFGLEWTAAGAPPDFAICNAPVPAVSTWGLVCMMLLLSIAGTGLAARRNFADSASVHGT